jgi:hypothetical protein
VREAREIVELAAEPELGLFRGILPEYFQRQDPVADNILNLIYFGDFPAAEEGKNLIAVSNQL